MKYTLPTDSAERKNYPVADGPLSYFPAAIAGVAHVCKLGNDKHNPGEPLHHARGKSGDHANCIMRHLMDVNDLRAYVFRHGHRTHGVEGQTAALLHEANQLAWRALALSQELHEVYGDAPLAPGAREPAPLLDYSHEIPLTPPAQCKAVRNTVYPLEFCMLPEDHEGDHVGPFGSWAAVAFPQEQADAAAGGIVGQIVCGSPRIDGPAGADWRAPTVQWPRG